MGLCHSFEIKLGDSCNFVGLQIERDRERKSMFIHQTKYATDVIKEFCALKEKTVSIPADPNVILVPVEDDEHVLRNVPYREVVGKLMSLTIVSRPDLPLL